MLTTVSPFAGLTGRPNVSALRALFVILAQMFGYAYMSAAKWRIDNGRRVVYNGLAQINLTLEDQLSFCGWVAGFL